MLQDLKTHFKPQIFAVIFPQIHVELQLKIARKYSTLLMEHLKMAIYT